MIALRVSVQGVRHCGLHRVEQMAARDAERRNEHTAVGDDAVVVAVLRDRERVCAW